MLSRGFCHSARQERPGDFLWKLFGWNVSCSERSVWSHQGYTGVDPVCSLDGCFTHSQGTQGCSVVLGAWCFLQMIFPAGEHRAGSADQGGRSVACGMRNLGFAVGMTCKKPSHGSWFSIFPALPWICFHCFPSEQPLVMRQFSQGLGI